jgi:guanosine-3',5'-bis(diphosphate) 3'-pyrophosphohydrolase
VAIGHRLLDQALARRDSSLEKVSQRRLDRYVKKAGLERLEDLLIRIARGEVLAGTVAQKLLPITQRRSEPRAEKDVFSVGGSERSAIDYANCCYPIPGDRIVGYLSAGRGIVVHRDSCPNVASLMREHPERTLDVAWDAVPRGTFSVMLRVVTVNGPGVLASVSSSIGQAGANIERVEQRESTSDTAELFFLVGLTGRDQLASVLNRLRRNPKVFRVSRETD